MKKTPPIQMKTTLSYLWLIIICSTPIACDTSNKIDEQSITEELVPERPIHDRPNILFIYTDDQARWAYGASGNKIAKTPSIDRLAGEGIQFPNAYTTTPVCSPSRAGLLTSRYGYELGIDDWINTHMEFIALEGIEPTLGLKTSFDTWPKLLSEVGYTTALIGKWHLGVLPEYHPTLHGYSEFIGFLEGGTTPIDPKLEIGGTIVQESGYTADVLTRHALNFIRNNKTKPFAISLNYRAPHTAWLPVAPEDSAPYESYSNLDIPNPNYPNLDVEKVRRYTAEYLSSVRSIDRNLGVILDEVKALGIEDNTMIIFTSDHGYNMGHNGIWHKGNGHWILKEPVVSESPNIPDDQRPNMYDNSIKVPLIVKWPVRIKAGSVNYSTLSNLDWFPTLAEIAQADIAPETKIRGQSMMPALIDENRIMSTEYYAAYTTKHQSITGMRMYSDGRYKLIRDFKNVGRDELYDVVSDPDESFNLIDVPNSKLNSVVQRLNINLLNKMEETNDPLFSYANTELLYPE